MSSSETAFNYDVRKFKIVGNELTFPNTRYDNKFMKYSPNEYLEASFLYPSKENVRTDGGLDIVVTYRKDNRHWLQDISELGQLYPTTLTKFLGTPNDVDAEVDDWLTNVMIKVTHDLPIGSVIQLNNPSDTIKHDPRQTVLVITGYNTDITDVYPWSADHVKIYKAKHIDIKLDLDDLNDSWNELKQLNNGLTLQNGGEGDIGRNDINCIIYDPFKYSLQVQLLQIKLYLKQQECDRYKSHCKKTAERAVTKMGDRLNRWLAPFFEDEKRKESFFIPKNIKSKEFAFLLKIRGIKKEWKKTNSTEKLRLEYKESISVFGTSAIVKNIRPRHGRSYILSNINIHWTYNISKEMMKMECFVKRINK